MKLLIQKKFRLVHFEKPNKTLSFTIEGQRAVMQVLISDICYWCHMYFNKLADHG